VSRLLRSALRRSALPVGTALVLAALLAALVAVPPARAQERRDPFPPAVEHSDAMRAPGRLSGPALPLGRALHTGYHAFLARPVRSTPQPLFLGLLEFYRTVVSPVNGSDADLAPVPSLYAVQAIKGYGVLLGSVLTTERLIHEPSAIPGAPRFREDGREFFYDPLPWNTYWLPAWLRDPAP
jgi:putative component of membrane protein insertase Oxa1/YidC/SpoIIIJ protein YidD